MKKKRARRPERYETLYAELLAAAENMHEGNKRRIRRGLWGLLALPTALAVIRAVGNPGRRCRRGRCRSRRRATCIYRPAPT